MYLFMYMSITDFIFKNSASYCYLIEVNIQFEEQGPAMGQMA